MIKNSLIAWGNIEFDRGNYCSFSCFDAYIKRKRKKHNHFFNFQNITDKYK